MIGNKFFFLYKKKKDRNKEKKRVGGPRVIGLKLPRSPSMEKVERPGTKRRKSK